MSAYAIHADNKMKLSLRLLCVLCVSAVNNRFELYRRNAENAEVAKRV